MISGELTSATSILNRKTKFLSIGNCTTIIQTTRALRPPATFWKLWQHLNPSVARVTTHGWHSRWDTTENPAAEAVLGDKGPRSEGWPTAWRGRWPSSLASGGTPSRLRISNSSTTKTNRCWGWPNGWWEFLDRLTPSHPVGNRYLRFWESRSFSDTLKTVSARDRTFGPGSYWDGWSGAEVLLLDPCQRTKDIQPCQSSGSHQGS